MTGVIGPTAYRPSSETRTESRPDGSDSPRSDARVVNYSAATPGRADRIRFRRPFAGPESRADARGIKPYAPERNVRPDANTRRRRELCRQCPDEAVGSSGGAVESRGQRLSIAGAMDHDCPCKRPPVARSRSWPMLCTVPEEEVPCNGGTEPTTTPPQLQPQPPPPARRQPQRRVAPANVGRLLRRHYYPEAGWGWVVVTCASLVHVLNHGTQLSFGALQRDVVRRFRDAADYSGTGQSARVWGGRRWRRRR